MMIEKLVKDESGIALGLAVIMILLIGVMGAGLLVFVRNDLEAVVEVNQGQKAFDIADAGIAAASAHLRYDRIAAHYDVDDAASPLYSAACDTTDPEEEGKPRIPAAEDWSLCGWRQQDLRRRRVHGNHTPPCVTDRQEMQSSGASVGHYELLSGYLDG